MVAESISLPTGLGSCISVSFNSFVINNTCYINIDPSLFRVMSIPIIFVGSAKFFKRNHMLNTALVLSMIRSIFANKKQIINRTLYYDSALNEYAWRSLHLFESKFTQHFKRQLVPNNCSIFQPI